MIIVVTVIDLRTIYLSTIHTDAATLLICFYLYISHFYFGLYTIWLLWLYGFVFREESYIL